jgi:2-oxoisovalerate dehydrogenase E2 component (dihydrolipoyl transacylase)
MSEFCLPDLAEGLHEAEIVAWHVAEGDHVVIDQPLVSVETEKAVVEIPSPKAGHVAQLHARPGDRVKVGTPLLSFEEGPHAQTGTVVGELARPKAEPVGPSVKAAGGVPVRAAPAVRARARNLGIDLASITPSGPEGTILLADITSASSPRTTESIKVLSGARRAMASNMTRAGREVVPASLHDEADVEGWARQEDVTVRLVRAIIAGCRAEPSLNSSFDAAALSLRPNSSIDLGIAIDSPDGLFVPVLRDMAKSGPQDWRRRIDAAKSGVRERTLLPAEFRNPTITLSNFGTIAGQHAALVIMPPQVAIVGAGRMTERAVRADAGVVMHRMLPLSVTFDHRAVTGGEAARFLLAITTDLQQAV